VAEDRVTAALDEIRERSNRPIPRAGSLPISHDGVRTLMESAGDVPRLLAALAALLADHRSNGRNLCAGCADVWPCRDYEIISAALLGEENSDV